MFDFQTDFRFTRQVEALVPTLDGQQKKTFTGIFRLVPKAEMLKAFEAVSEDHDTVLMRLAFIGWKDDLTQNGRPWPYSEAARDELLSVNFIRAAIAMAYWRAVNGVAEEPGIIEKN